MFFGVALLTKDAPLQLREDTGLLGLLGVSVFSPCHCLGAEAGRHELQAMGLYRGVLIGVSKGDTRNLDYSSHEP